ncbi:MAG TPA: hypothetical protein VEI07_10415 [Planctomycetaceae bacterium]|nr:hypothetical protein [Planctomycetaceae bacterium]
MDEKKQRWRVPEIRVCLVGHFLHADLARCFGRRFYDELFRPVEVLPNIELSGRKRLKFVAQGRNFADHTPIVEFFETPDGSLFAIRVATVDTGLPFLSGSLEHLSQTFLGIGKADTMSKDEKKEMRNAFLRRPHEAFGYALRDAVLTLMLYEEMFRRDRAMYEEFGLEPLGPMKPTLGSRVADFVFTALLQSVCDSKLLKTPRNLRRLMQGGAIHRFGSTAEGSHFGEQTGAIHGALRYSRTPIVFWHEARGLLRDVDLRACYPTIAARMNVYFGKPVLFEPGNQRMSLHDGVAFASQYSNGDGWFIRASGNLSAIDNALVPSTVGALTSDNFRMRSRTRLKSSGNDAENASGETKFRAKLYSRRIESGVFTAATWTMVKALPERARQEYGDLIVESIVFYPKKFVADSGAEYDRLCDERRRDGLRWTQTIDLDLLRRLEELQLDHEEVVIKCPVGDLVKKFAQSRQKARDECGRGSGAEMAWKFTSNAVFGILGSSDLVTGNCVAANVITAHGRAVAFAMFQSLNGLQLATDGCTYRLDRIPRCTLAECLAVMPDYLLRHADVSSGIPFYDPSEIPQTDVAFNHWFVRHAAHFFGIDDSDVRQVLVHQLEHKHVPGRNTAAFDALLCDGGSNCLKLIETDDEWDIYDIKMQGYGDASKKILANVLLPSYASDRMRELTPITADRNLLKLKPAKSAAKRVLTDCDADEVFLPMGLEQESIKAYKVLKPSAFVFQTPKQEAAILRQLDRLHQQTGCGLDLLALRRCHGERAAGSLTAAARELYDYIRGGGRDLVKKFNLRVQRLSPRIRQKVEKRHEERQRLQRSAARRLAKQIVVSKQAKSKPLTGILIRRSDVAKRRSLMRAD